MQDYRVGVCDNDTGYVIGFMEFINMKEDIPLKISAFSGLEAVADYKKENRLDLLLLGTGFEKNDLEIRVVKLTDNKSLANETDYIYKYQSLYKISEQLVFILNKGRQKINTNRYVYGIYSPIGRSGKTNLARGICNCYSESLYIGLEEYSGCFNKTYEGKRYREVYERFMYYLTGENALITDTINELYEETGLRALVTLDFMDIKQIEQQHIMWFTQLLTAASDYKRVVFDIGAGVLSDLDIMFAMDKIFVPVLKDKISINKLNAFKLILSEKKYSELEKKVKYLEVPKADWSSETMKDFITQSGI